MRYLYPDSSEPTSFEEHDELHGVDPDLNYEATLYARATDGEPAALFEALRIIINYTHHHVPAKYRLDEMEDVLMAAARHIERDMED